MSRIIRERSATLQKFVGGLNNYWDPSSIADNELASMINFEVNSNGALASRPAIYVETGAGETPIYTPVANQHIDILGDYVKSNGDRYFVAVTNAKTWIYNIATKAWTEIAAFKATDCTQYLNKIVLSSATAGQGGYWENGVFTNTPSMPALGGIELFQTRFFGFGIQGTTTANIIYWSDISSAGPEGESTSVWNWLDNNNNYYYVEIGGGDGQWITAMAQGYNDIVVFRNRSTYRFSYGELPEEGTLQAMQQDIGAETRRCVAKFENAHFVLSGQTLYKYQNWLYYPLNAERVKFVPTDEFTPRFQHAISIVGRRCIVWHGGSVYSYNLDNQTWSQWDTATRAGYFVTIHRQNEDAGEERYYGVSGDSAVPLDTLSDHAVFRIEDEFATSNGVEEFICSLKTKIYDFETPAEWKRLFFWTADVAASGEIQAVAYPVAVPAETPQATWDEISKDSSVDTFFSSWDDLSKEDGFDITFGTWDALKAPSFAVPTLLTAPVANKASRIELKLNNSLRFRRIYFELYFSCDGTSATSPVQVFSITPMVGVKAKVSEGVN